MDIDRSTFLCYNTVCLYDTIIKEKVMLSYDDRFLRFSFAIDQIAKNLQKIKNEKLARFGLRSMHLMCLFQLDKNPDGLTAAVRWTKPLYPV